MLRDMVGLALLSVVVTSTALAKPPAGDPPPPSHIYRFAGFSTGTERGGAGIPAMYATCQVDFGDSARMCTVEEYFRSPNAQHSDQNAWVQDIDSFRLNSGESCIGWSGQSTTNFGLTIGPSRITTASCNPPRPITCCTPLQ